MKRTDLWRVAVLLMSLAGMVWVVVTIWPRIGHTDFDDSYMFLRYAKHFLSGHGFSWNISDGPSYGSTSTTYLFLVTVLAGLMPFTDSEIITYASFGAGLGTLILLTVMGFKYFPLIRRTWIPLAVIPVVGLGSMFAYHCTTGMETTFSMFFNTILAAGVVALYRRTCLASMAFCLVAAWLVYLTRPDMGLFAALSPAMVLATAKADHKRLAMIYFGAFVVLVILDALAKKLLFGEFLPLPLFAKSSGFYQGYMGIKTWNAGEYGLMFLREAIVPLLIILLLAKKRSETLLLSFGFPLVLTMAYLGTVVQIMGFNSRYYYPMMPFIIVMALVVLEDWMSSLGKSTTGTYEPDSAEPESEPVGEAKVPGSPVPHLRSRRYFGAAVVFVVLTSPWTAGLVQRTWAEYVIPDPVPSKSQVTWANRRGVLPEKLGWWQTIKAVDRVLDRVPGNITIAASEYGLLGANHPDLTIVDMVGLHDRYIAKRGFSADYVLDRNPDIIWLPHHHYTYDRMSLLDDPYFNRDYLYFEGLFDYGFAIARNSPYLSIIVKSVVREVKEAYPGFALADFHSRVISLYGDAIPISIN